MRETTKVLLIVAMAVVALNVPARGEQAGPTLYLPLDNPSYPVVTDFSGNANHGTMHGNPRLVAGRFGQALSFDGKRDYIIVPDAPGLQFRGDFTVMLWVRTTVAPEDVLMLALMGKRRFHSEEPKRAGWNINILFRHPDLVRFSGADGTVHASKSLKTKVTLNDGQWHHLAVSRDARQKQLRIYVDGELKSSSAWEPGDLWLDQPLKIGLGPWGYTGMYFKGSLDEVYVYDRALDDEEIASHFRGERRGRPRKYAINIYTGGETPKRYYVRGQPMPLSLTFISRQPAERFTLEAKLVDPTGKAQEAFEEHSSLKSAGTRKFNFTIATDDLAYGEYKLRVEASAGGRVLASAAQEVGVYPVVDDGFFFGVRSPNPQTVQEADAILKKLAAHDLNPAENANYLFWDKCLKHGLRYIARGVGSPWVKLYGPDGKPAEGRRGMSDPARWDGAAQAVAHSLSEAARFPAFYPYMITNDDMSAQTGWDWSEHNRRRFRELYGKEAPVPEELVQNYKFPYGTDVKLTPPSAVIDRENSWLLWNRFLSRDVYGAYNTCLLREGRKVLPEVLYGQVATGGHQKLFRLHCGMYPEYVFGKKHGFNLLSRYEYADFHRPSICCLYWSEIARMGNRDLPQLAMPDIRHPEPSYLLNVFYLLLAGDVEAIDYFVYDWAEQGAPYTWNTAKQEGALIDRMGAFLTAIEPEDYSVGFLSSFTTGAFDIHYPFEAMFPYANLLQAHIDVEPLSESEILAGRLSRYKALLMPRVSCLTQDVYDAIQAYIKGGGTVILERNSPFLMPGAVKVPLTFTCGEDRKGEDDPAEFGTWHMAYGHPQRIEAIRSCLRRHIPPTATVSDPEVIVRRFRAGAARYLWLVDLHTRGEYLWLREEHWGEGKRGHENFAKIRQYVRERGFGSLRKKVRVSLRTERDYAVYEVLEGRRLPSSFRDGWLTFEAEVPKLEAALIALYPQEIAKVRVALDRTGKQGRQEVSVEVNVWGTDVQTGKRRLVEGLQPILVKVVNPQGGNSLYSRQALCRDGSCEVRFALASNDFKGKWKVRVEELASHLSDAQEFVLGE